MSIYKEAWVLELERVSRRVSDTFIAEYRDIVARFDELFQQVQDLEEKLDKKEIDLWEGLSKDSKSEVSKPKHYRAKLNAMQQWWSTKRPRGRATFSLTLPKDRKKAAELIQSELDVMSRVLKYGEKQLAKWSDELEENPPAPAIIPEMN